MPESIGPFVRKTSTRDGRYVTLQDVARRAGVSAKTVSRVVNQQGEISEATRGRIQTAIADLGYRPNVLARSLIHQRTNTLATVAWGIDFFGPSRTVIGIEQQSDELGYSLFLSLVPEPQFHDHQKILDTLLSHRVDGIIWAVPEVGENHSWLTPEQLRQLPPIVFISMPPKRGVMVVAVDNRLGARQAVQHMITRGRKRIGMLTGPLAWWEARERREGWREAMGKAGLEAPDEHAVECHWSAAKAGGHAGAAAARAGYRRRIRGQRPDRPGGPRRVIGSRQACAGGRGAGGLRRHPRGAVFPSAAHDRASETGRGWPHRRQAAARGHRAGRTARGHTVRGSTTMIAPELIVRASST